MILTNFFSLSPAFRSLHVHFSQNRLASGFAKYGLLIALQYKMASCLNARKKLRNVG